MTTARLYARVSSKIQVEGFSLAAQRNRMTAYAEYQGWENTEYYEDPGISGKRDDRPGLTSLMLDLQPGDVVVVYSLSRLGRGGAVQLLGIVRDLRGKGARLVSLTESIDTDTPTGRLMLTILAALAELEIETTSERTESGRVEAALQGIWPMGSWSLPTGYTRGEDGRLIESPQADHVRLVFELAPGRTYLQIAHELTARGIPAPLAQSWNGVTVQKIIQQEAYHTGVLQFRKERYPDDPTRWIPIPAPQLVSTEDWQAAQRNRRNTRHPGRDRQSFPLTALLVCACGTPITGQQRYRAAGSTRYYRCVPASRSVPTCEANGQPTKSWRAEQIEQEVRQVIYDTLRNPSDPANLRALYGAPTTVDPHAAERAEIERKLNRLLDLYLGSEDEDTGLDRATYLQRRATLQARLTALQPPPAPAPQEAPDFDELAQAVLDAPMAELAEMLEIMDAELIVMPGGKVRVGRLTPILGGG